jgi:hypothetical protein
LATAKPLAWPDASERWFAVAFHLLLDAPDDAELNRRRDEALRRHRGRSGWAAADGEGALTLAIGFRDIRTEQPALPVMSLFA